MVFPHPGIPFNYRAVSFELPENRNTRLAQIFWPDLSVHARNSGCSRIHWLDPRSCALLDSACFCVLSIGCSQSRIFSRLVASRVDSRVLWIPSTPSLISLEIFALYVARDNSKAGFCYCMRRRISSIFLASKSRRSFRCLVSFEDDEVSSRCRISARDSLQTDIGPPG